MKIISWNLNGLLSCIKHQSFTPINQLLPDIKCLQDMDQEEPLRTIYGFNNEYPDPEGRLLTLEFPKVYVVNVYVPNSQKNLKRHAYRMEWDAALQKYVSQLSEDKSVIICGDFNVAREDIDIYEENLRQYWAEQGYVSDERSSLETLLEMGLTAVYRLMTTQPRYKKLYMVVKSAKKAH